MPKVAISDGFLEAYTKLPKTAQNKTRTFTHKFRQNPTSAAINYESIHGVRDQRVRTARVDQSYRAVVLHPNKGDVYTLVWVDNHDEAMEWAQRRTFDTNPASGALLVTNTVDSQVFVDALDEPSTAEAALFDPFDDQAMETLGIPDPVLPSIRKLQTKDQLADLVPHIAADTAEKLKLLAIGFSPDEVLELIADGVTFDADLSDEEDTAAFHRTTTRINSAEELDKVLDAPLETWRLFLHPKQTALAKGHFSGPALVLGGAGTGKTVVAMHRARHLARDVFHHDDDRILVTTFTANLATSIEDNLRNLCGDEFQRIEVNHLHQWSVRFMSDHGTAFNVASPEELADCWDQAILQSGITGRNVRFIRTEWESVVQALGITSRDEFLQADRRGRPVPLNRTDRAELWKVFELFQDKLHEQGKVDWTGVVKTTREFLENNPGDCPFRSVIVDEAQDFGPEEWRLVRALAPEGPNDLLLVGDPRQRIYGRQLELSRSGIHVAERVHRLHLNYRTTEQIRDWAVQLLSDQRFDDLNGELDELRGYQSLMSGPEPTIRRFNSPDAEAAALLKVLASVLEQLEPEEICVTARSSARVRELKESIAAAGHTVLQLGKRAERSKPGIRLANMHRIKGLEFKCVILASVDEDKIPIFDRAAEDDAADFETHVAKERCLLHVAVTRARDQAIIMTSGTPSPFLEPFLDLPNGD